MIDILTVTEFVESCNDYLRSNFDGVMVEGEVAEFKINQGKWVFFSLKDESSTLNCFLPLFKLSVELEDGMKVRVKGYPKVTPWGKFSFTIEKIIPTGEGDIKKAFERLKRKLQAEGLFDPERKRPLPENPVRIGVISSTSAAGYADFCKIVNARWGGLEIQTCHTQVQGLDAPDQIIRALDYLNEKAEVEVIAIIRGGGSKDDLSCFNDELLARAIASSRIPVITGIGHEIDESIADLVADARASTPSNCAELLTRDRVEELRLTEQKRLHIRSRLFTAMKEVYDRSHSDLSSIGNRVGSVVYELDVHRATALEKIGSRLKSQISAYETDIVDVFESLRRQINRQIDNFEQKLNALKRVLEACNPDKVLSQGYAILRGKVSPGEKLEITTSKQLIDAKITKVTNRERN